MLYFTILFRGQFVPYSKNATVWSWNSMHFRTRLAQRLDQRLKSNMQMNQRTQWKGTLWRTKKYNIYQNIIISNILFNAGHRGVFTKPLKISLRPKKLGVLKQIRLNTEAIRHANSGSYGLKNQVSLKFSYICKKIWAIKLKI